MTCLQTLQKLADLWWDNNYSRSYGVLQETAMQHNRDLLEAFRRGRNEKTVECERFALAPTWRKHGMDITHWETCWQDHRLCALDRIARLQAENAELRAETDELEAENNRLRKCADAMADVIQNQLDSGDSPGELTFALHEYNAFFPREEDKHGG